MLRFVGLCLSALAFIGLSACQPKPKIRPVITAAETLGSPITADEAEQIFDYAYPLVIMKISQDMMFTIPFRSGAGPNHFIHFEKLASPKNKAVVLGNRNTLYSVGWVDVSAGPVIFELPDMGERYFVMPLLDAWTNTFASLGSRTTGQSAQKYFLVAADWQGGVPDGYTKIICPTSMVWITGRIQVDSAADSAAVVKLQEGTRLMTYQEAQGGGDPIKDYKPAFKAVKVRKPVPYSLNMTAADYYDVFFGMRPGNTAPPRDAAMLAILETAGITAQTRTFEDLAPNVQAQLTAALNAKQTEYLQAFYDGTDQTESWIFNLDPDMGDWDTDYPRRAYWAMWGLGTNISKDAVYGVTQLDSALKPLNGQNNYHVHIPPGGAPPTQAFWSITTYDIDGYLEANSEKRYALGSNHELSYNPDGSLDIYLSHAKPGADKPNWIPAPKADFKILFRIYWPGDAVLAGDWSLPAIEKLAD